MIKVIFECPRCKGTKGYVIKSEDKSVGVYCKKCSEVEWINDWEVEVVVRDERFSV